MAFTISLSEYKMLHPDTAEFPTLAQSGALAALLAKRRFEVACLAHRRAKRQARRQAVFTWLGCWWAKLRLNGARPVSPAFARVARHP